MSKLLADAEKHLRQYAQLSDFWLLRTPHIQPGLIHYFDAEGRAFVLMDDDDNRVEQCVALLEARGCPVFEDVAAMDSFIERRISNAE